MNDTIKKTFANSVTGRVVLYTRLLYSTSLCGIRSNGEEAACCCTLLRDVTWTCIQKERKQEMNARIFEVPVVAGFQESPQTSKKKRFLLENIEAEKIRLVHMVSSYFHPADLSAVSSWFSGLIIEWTKSLSCRLLREQDFSFANSSSLPKIARMYGNANYNHWQGFQHISMQLLSHKNNDICLSFSLNSTARNYSESPE